jgi:beta-N-acetylhexosaminidase
MPHNLRVLIAVVLLAVAGCGGSSERSADPSPTATAKAKATEEQDDNSISIEEIERENERARRREQPSPTPTTAATSTPEPPPTGKPAITQAPIPFPAKRKAEMAAYAQRHYGIDSYRLENPEVIVQHFTVTATAQQAIDIFTPDVPDSELHELPGTCAHFVIDTDGTILQLVPLTIMCRHTVGLNYTSIGIEHVGSSDEEVLGNSAQMKSSLALTRWLMARYGIEQENVIGHNESLSSPFHKENVAALQSQTHEDFAAASMDRYRSQL